MAESQVKFRIKIGHIEIDYEGSEAFLRDDLASLMGTVPGLVENAKSTKLNDVSPTQSTESETKNSEMDLALSTATIASRLNAKSGPELVIAAAARFCLCEGKNKFSRSEILQEMKKATAYYKPPMSSNLSKNLNSLVKGNRLNEFSPGNYALTVNESNKLRNSLAQHI